MAPRKTLKGRGWNYLVGVGPTRNPNQSVYKSKSGILVSRSKTQNLPIFSRDGGKTWNYIFTTWDAGYQQSPLKNAADGFAAFKEMKQVREEEERKESDKKFEISVKRYQEDLQRRIATGDPHELYPADGEPFRQAWVKVFGLRNDTPFEKVEQRYNDMVDARNRRGTPYINPLDLGNTAQQHLDMQAATAVFNEAANAMSHHHFGGKKTRKNRRKSVRRRS